MEDSYRRYFDAMPCYVTVQDRDFRILEANRRFQDDFGPIDGRFCYQVYKQRSEKCEVCPVEKAFWDGQSHRSEERVRRPDGEEISVLVEAAPVRGPDGKIEAVIEMSTDVTQIKDLQRQLRRSQRRYHLLFDEVPCYISIQDPELHIVEANRAFQEDFGTSCMGQKCYAAYKRRSEPCAPCPVQEAFDDGRPHTREEVVTSNDGEQMNVLVTAAPIRNRRGEITRVMEMSADITQVRQLEDRLTKLGLLIGSISHGLKGMLNGLAGGMYLVDSGFAKDDRGRLEKGWDTVQRNVARIRSMVSDILYYAKDRTPNWEPLAAAEVAEDVCELSRPRAKQQNVQLTATLDAAGKFEADAQAVRSMLVNLIENSIDACRLDGGNSDHRVEVRLKGLADSVRFEVEDNGIGMDQETREKAFSLFFSSKGTEGTGLGLFVSNRIARAHGGSIELESEPGVGTRFIVELPRRRPSQAAPEDPPTREKETSHG